ncbi:energy transducer TonB [Fulvivirgaceae bacterium BMA12]|uniref:Energy transducer TonB n=1 Tax=Agaribacillus aureus TaxID=3051825 RepID=A0ABT8L4C3_9BACT|nr:energy transducer TonB [Fulvivirgaceae bacterium BMA12]
MEVKKKRKADVYRSRSMYLNLGLVVALLFAISAFQWRFYEEGDLIVLGSVDNSEEELLIIPPTVHPPPKPKIQQPKIIEVKDDEVIDDLDLNLDMEIDEDEIVEVVIYDDPEEEEEADAIWVVVEKQPAPMGGMAAFQQFLKKNLKYPSQARRLGVEGKVFVEFVVDKDGSLNDIKVVKGIGAGCDKEAVRVLEKHPKWSPGEQRGRPVKVRMIIPIFFRLG